MGYKRQICQINVKKGYTLKSRSGVSLYFFRCDCSAVHLFLGQCIGRMMGTFLGRSTSSLSFSVCLVYTKQLQRLHVNPPFPFFSREISMHFSHCCLYYSVPLAASISQLVFPLWICYLFLSLCFCPYSCFPIRSNPLKHNGPICFHGEMVIGPNDSVQTFRHTNVNKPLWIQWYQPFC